MEIKDANALPNGLPAQPQNKPVQAMPAVYIEVIIQDRKTVYDIETARYVRDELDAALKGLEPVTNPKDADAPQAPPET